MHALASIRLAAGLTLAVAIGSVVWAIRKSHSNDDPPAIARSADDSSSPGVPRQDRDASVDISNIDRKIVREPPYIGDPLYGLIIFDPKGASRAWFVLDKSTPEMKELDVLYLDRNGNGDLTEPGERYVTPKNEGGTIVHEAGPIQPSKSGPEHTDFRLYASMVQRGVTPFFRIKIEGKLEMWGGFAKPGERGKLGTKPEEAPIFVASLEPPLTFLLFTGNNLFDRGRSVRIAVVVGVPGSGPASFMAVHENFLVPGRDRLFGTWFAMDDRGREAKERFEIRSHC